MCQRFEFGASHVAAAIGGDHVSVSGDVRLVPRRAQFQQILRLRVWQPITSHLYVLR